MTTNGIIKIIVAAVLSITLAVSFLYVGYNLLNARPTGLCTINGNTEKAFVLNQNMNWGSNKPLFESKDINEVIEKARELGCRLTNTTIRK